MARKKVERERYILYLPNNIYFLRKEHKIKQEDLANRLGYNPSTIANWEAGRRTPDPFDLYEMSKLFGIDIDDLVSKDLEAEYYEIKKYSKKYRKEVEEKIENT